VKTPRSINLARRPKVPPKDQSVHHSRLLDEATHEAPSLQMESLVEELGEDLKEIELHVA